MEKWFSIFLVLICSSNPILVFANSDFEQLKRQKTCINAYEIANSRLETLSNIWLSNVESSFNLQKNFEILTAQHAEYFSKIRDFANEFSQTPDQIEDLLKQLDKIDETYFDIIDEISFIDDADNRFVKSLPYIEEGLSEVGSDLEHAKEVCSGDWQNDIVGQIKLTKEWRVKIATMRSYIMEASSDRWKLFTLVLESRKLELKRRYAQNVRRELENILTEIDTVRAADELYTRIHNWWQKVTVGPGIGRGLGHYYLQFSKALRILKIDIEQVHSFEQELLALPDIFPGVRSQISGDLELYKSLLVDQVNILETGGWQSIFEKQKMMTNRRWEIRNRYSKQCQASIAAFLGAIKGNIKEDNFKIIEDIYYQQVVECSRGNNEN